MSSLFIPTLPTLTRLHASMRTTLYALACVTILFCQSAKAQSDDPDIVDLTPDGWTRNTDLNKLFIDQYLSSNGSISLQMMAFPPTDFSAQQWIDSILPAILSDFRESGADVKLINEDESNGDYVQGTMNSSDGDVDMATRTFRVRTKSTDNQQISRVVRAIVRQGQPVQFSLLDLGGERASEKQWQQASGIRFKANLPFNAAAAFMGVETMAVIMVQPLLSNDNVQANNKKQNTEKNASTQSATVSDEHTKAHNAAHQKVLENAQNNTSNSSNASKQAQNTSTLANADNAPSVDVRDRGKGAPLLTPLPGPQVNLTGDWLGSLPAGYRMHIKTKNYWTNYSMTATRTLHLTLTASGEFETASYSIDGGMGGVTGTVFSSDKHGSSGAVFGDTNQGGPGTRSMAMSKHEGLDPAKYGVYYISGNQIEFRYANGKVENKSFKTDGHLELVIDGKRYFTGSTEGWEKRDVGDKTVKYRSIDGAYLARVRQVGNNIDNGFQWMRDFLARRKKADSTASATEIKGYKGQNKSYNVVRTTISGTGKSGKKYSTDIYLKYGRLDNRLVQVDRYGGAISENTILDFVKGID